MIKSTNGLKALLLSTTFGLGSCNTAFQTKAEQETPPLEQKTHSTVRAVILSKDNCPEGILEVLVNKDRVALFVDISPEVRHMVGYLSIIQDVITEYEGKVRTPMDIFLIEPGTVNTTGKAACWTAHFSDQHNIVIAFDQKILALGRLRDDSNPGMIDSVLGLTRNIDLAQNLALSYKQAKIQPQRPYPNQVPTLSL